MKTLADFRNIHAGQSIIVCGLGESIRTLTPAHREHMLTIGVNDVGRYFHPDYLVCINAPETFVFDRWRHIFDSEARFLFTQLDLTIRKTKLTDYASVVRFKLGKKRGVDLSSDDSLPYTSNSPYVALCLAAFMGAKRIGIIGVDFVNHPNLTNAKRIDKEYAALGDALKSRGVEVFNLSAISRLNAFEKMSVEEFAK